ncbi:hypothetical protein QJS10_CPA16g00526 [Acorus calamus]|uniref:Uncharacterized protein n=1 Tax=Acorus calamus TaxID=4465 RepID=A0AAV9CZZ4_ACOCL|nr:hypothetical protein QJS10_CPA16g00526 [Acorus calamus]
MATRVPTSSTFLIFFLSILVGAYCRSGLESSESVATLHHHWDFKSGPPLKELLFQSGEETAYHLFIECPVACQLWRRLKLATVLPDNRGSLDELWMVGKQMRQKGDRSASGKITQSYIPAME